MSISGNPLNCKTLILIIILLFLQFSILNTSTISMETIDTSQSTQVWFVSHAERRNARFQRNMEDTHTIIPMLNGQESIFFAGVYDGHGGLCFAELFYE